MTMITLGHPFDTHANRYSVHTTQKAAIMDLSQRCHIPLVRAREIVRRLIALPHGYETISGVEIHTCPDENHEVLIAGGRRPIMIQVGHHAYQLWSKNHGAFHGSIQGAVNDLISRDVDSAQAKSYVEWVLQEPYRHKVIPLGGFYQVELHNYIPV